MKKIQGKRGQIAILDGDECISKWVAQSGRLDHDQNMLPRLKPYIPVGGNVIDCGAFIGDHTLFYSDYVGSEGQVFAFEPSKEAFECLKFNRNLAYFDNISIVNKALGAKAEKRGITKVETNDGMNYLTDGNDIEITTIDDYFPNTFPIHFIKIDCEGYEMNVLMGGEQTIRKWKPAMLIEINQMALDRVGQTRENIYRWLDARGYDYHNIYPEQGLNQYQMDIICF